MILLVKIKSEFTIEDIKQTLPVTVVRDFPALPFTFVIEIAPGDLAQLQSSDKFLMLEPETPMGLMEMPSKTVRLNYSPVETNQASTDPDYGTLDYWHLNAISQRSGASLNSNYFYNKTGDGVDIYIVDSGVNENHPECAGRVFGLPDTDFPGNLNLVDTKGHGTYSAAFAAGTRTGVAKDAHIYSAKWESTNVSVVTALQACLVHHTTKGTGRPSIVNMSLGSVTNEDSPYFFSNESDAIKPNDSIIEDTVVTLLAQGMHCSASAGNGFTSSAGGLWGPHIIAMQSPARMAANTDVICVGASNQASPNFSQAPFIVPDNKMSEFSNYGIETTVIAPGHALPCIDYEEIDYLTNGLFSFKSGTSFSAPIVSGVMALWLESNNALTTTELKQNIIDSSGNFVIPNIGNFDPADHEYSDGVVSWGGDITRIFDTGISTTSSEIYNYQLDFNTPNNFLYNTHQNWYVQYAEPTLSAITATPTGDFPEIDAGGNLSTYFDATPFPVKYSLTNNPAGITIDEDTGALTGSGLLEGVYVFDVTIYNDYESDTRTITVTVPEIFIPAWTPITGLVSISRLVP